MIRKLFLILAVFTLTDCKFNEDKKITDFNQNPEIESAIYKKHFFEKELLDEDEMEVDVVGEKTLYEGSQVPIQTEKFPEPYYVNSLVLNYVGWNRLALSGLVEIRAIYLKNSIDLTAFEDDLELEWEKLHSKA